MTRLVRLGGGPQRRALVPVLSVLVAFAVAPPVGAAVNALVRGKLVHCGGVPGRRVHCYPTYHAVVSAFNRQHRLVAKEWVADGRFSFELRPGRYTLLARSDRQGATGGRIKARPDRIVHTVLRFLS
jgi:hypothetical protein